MKLKKVFAGVSIASTIAASSAFAWGHANCYRSGVVDDGGKDCVTSASVTLGRGGATPSYVYVTKYTAGRDLTTFGYLLNGTPINGCFAQAIHPTTGTQYSQPLACSGLARWDMYGKDHFD